MQRRTFLNQSIKSVLALGVSNCAVSCVVANSEQRNLSGGDDLKKIKNLLADRNTPIKWLFTGDSITHGAKHTYGLRSYPEIFSERVRFEMGRSRDFIIINTAISGHTTVDIKNDFDWRIKQFSPQVISLMIGTNDAANGKNISLTQYEDNLNWLINNFRKMNAIPIINTPNTIKYIAPGGDTRTNLPNYMDVLLKVAKSNNTILVDHWKYWSNNETAATNNGWFADPLHPSGKGHLQMARLLFKTIGIFDDKSFTCTGDIKC